MKRITLVRLIVGMAILIVLGAGMAVVITNSNASMGGSPTGFVH